MKNLQQFFESANFDAKNITNKSGKVIDFETLQSIENSGVTSEQLQNLGVPVFKYKTQITIHGLFPELQNNYLAGYKSIFQNKNLSIGVKYTAVDYTKKKYIFELVRFACEGWKVQRNSSDFYIYKTSAMFHTKADYLQHLAELQQQAQKIDTKLFWGTVNVFLSQSLFGGYFLVLAVNIGGVLLKNVNAVIENITGQSVQSIENAMQQAKETEAKEQAIKDAERQIQAKKNAKIKERLMPQIIETLQSLGFKKVEKYALQPNDITVNGSIDFDTETVEYKTTLYTRESRQKKFRYQDSKYTKTPELKDFSTYKRETIKTTFTGWLYCPEQKTEPKPQAKPENKPMPTKITGAKIELVEYSDKAIAVFGDTKPLKERFKALKGRFNPYLTHNGQKMAGWIFSKAVKKELQAMI